MSSLSSGLLAALLGQPHVTAPESSLYYDGGGERLEVPQTVDHDFTKDTAVTILRWVKFGAFGAAQSLFSKLNAGLTRGLNFNATAADRLSFRMFRTAATDDMLATGSVDISALTGWHLVAATYDGGGNNNVAGVSLHIDGAPDGAVAGTTNTLTGDSTVAAVSTMGALSNGTESLTGNIGVAVVLDRALSDAEHVIAYKGGAWSDFKNGPYRADLVDLYNPDDLAGAVLSSSGPAGNDATMAGGMVNANQALDSPFFYTPPSTMTECVAWWRGDLGITLAAAKASAWADQTGKLHAATQGADARRPDFVDGVLPYLEFVAADTEYFDVANMAETSNDYTVVEVLIPVAAFTGFSLSTSQPAALGTAFYVGEGGPSKISAHNATTGVASGFNTVAELQYAMFEINSAVPDIDISKNGGAPVNRAFVATTAFTGATQIGKHTAAGQPTNMQLHEMMIFNRLLTGGEKTALQAYFAARYGL